MLVLLFDSMTFIYEAFLKVLALQCDLGVSLIISLMGFSFLRNCGDRPWEVEFKNLVSNKLQVSNYNPAKDDLSLSSDSLW